MGLLLLAGGVGLSYLMEPSGPVTSPSEYVQLTDFTDSVVAPSLSPDGRMVTFKRGEDSFLSPGQIYVKLLPNGEPVQAHDYRRARVRTGVHTGRIADRVFVARRNAGSWDTWTVPVHGGRSLHGSSPTLRTHVDQRSTGAVFRDQDADSTWES